MTKRGVAIVVLAAGQGTRMKSQLPKVLHSVAGRPMLRHVLDAGASLEPDRVVVVVGKGQEQVAAAAAPATAAVQNPPRGTGHAVMVALPALNGFDGDVVVLFGDTPLLTPDLLKRLVEARRGEGDPAAVVVGFTPAEPAAYGRLILGSENRLERIVEYKNASAQERAVRLCNAGLMALDGARLPLLLQQLSDDNAQWITTEELQSRDCR